MSTIIPSIVPLIEEWVSKRSTYIEIKGNPNSTEEDIEVALEAVEEAKRVLDEEIVTKPILNVIILLIKSGYV